MKHIIEFTGRFAVVILIAIMLEGMCTLGSVFQFEHYNWFAWLIQSFVIIICIWFTYKWGKEDNAWT